MQRFLTPLLRRLYALVALVALVYYTGLGIKQSNWNKERHYQRLLSGAHQQKLASAVVLVELGGRPQLLRALRAQSALTRDVALRALQVMWDHEAGEEAHQLMQNGRRAVGRQDYDQALYMFNRLIRNYPDFAEGWNCRATLHWHLRQFRNSIQDCRRAIELNPDHFGAWQGIGLCELHLGNWEAARRAFRASLRIHPNDEQVRRWLIITEDLLRLPPPARSDWTNDWV